MYGFETGASIKSFHAYTSHSTTQNDQNVLLHYKVRLALSAAPCPVYFIKLLPRTLQTPVNPHSIICRRVSERTLTIPPHNHCPGVPALFTAYRNEHYIEYLHFLALHLPDRWLHRFQLDFSNSYATACHSFIMVLPVRCFAGCSSCCVRGFMLHTRNRKTKPATLFRAGITYGSNGQQTSFQSPNNDVSLLTLSVRLCVCL